MNITMNLLKNCNFHELVLNEFDNYTNIKNIKCFKIFTYI